MERWQRGTRKHESICKCAHERITHYTKEGRCVVPGCGCVQFRTKGRAPFQNKRARCEYNHPHNSGDEIKRCFVHHCEKLAGEIKDFEAEKVVELLGPSGAVIGTYKADFFVTENDDTFVFEECKGDHIKHLQPWPLKWALLKDKHKGDPKYKFRVILG